MAVDYTFQASVPMYPAIGVPGAYASINPIVSTAIGYTAKTAVNIGGFVWEDANDDRKVNSNGTGAPVGFVCREITNVLPFGTPYANVVPAGQNVSVQKKGDFFVQAAAAVTKGQKVFASLTDGSVSAAAAGATVEGSVETDFYFVTTAEAGEISVISNW